MEESKALSIQGTPPQWQPVPALPVMETPQREEMSAWGTFVLVPIASS